MEAELKSEEPMELGGNVSSSEDGDQDIIVTLSQRREPMAMSIHGRWDAERRSDIPVSRKCAASSDATAEQGTRRTWSPSLAPSVVG